MKTSRLGQWISIGACVLAFTACKSGDDDDDDDTGGTGGATTGAGGTSMMGSGGKGAAGTGTGGKGGSGGTGSGGKGGTGGAGSGGTGSGGMGSGGSLAKDAGADAMTGAGSEAVATIAGFSGGTVTGTATFMQMATDVTVAISLSNCADGMHPVHIHEGTSCMDAAAQGMHWGPMRGEMIPNVMCTGMKGTVMYTRPATMADLAWTVGGAAATNVIGHAFVVHNNDDAKTRVGCGVIMAD